MNLRPSFDLARKRKEGRILLRFALDLAKLQKSEGRHFVLENPIPSKAWTLPEMEQALLDLESFEALFDQCRLGLCDDQGNPHKKPTKFCTSSEEIAQAFDGLRCLKDHVHRPVLGGSRITSAAGIYPRGLAKALVSGIEAQFVKEFKTPQEVLMMDDGPQPELPGVTKADHSESEEELVPAEDQPKVSAGVKCWL